MATSFVEIAPGIVDLFHANGYFKGGNVHAFLLDTPEGIILIDTLFDADAQVILDALAARGKTARDIKHILLTHGHRAHLGGVAKLKQLSGAPVYAHPWEADIVSGDRPQQGVNLLPMKGIQVWPILFFGTVLGPLSEHKPCPVDQLIGEGDRIGAIQVLHTPGHTPGHLVFYWQDRRAMFTGDAFVTWPLICPGWPNTMLNKKQTWESLRRMSEMDVEVAGVGHGAPIARDAARVMRDLSARGYV